MKSTYLALSLAMAGITMHAAEKPNIKSSTGTLGRIERLNPKLDELIPPNATIEKLAEGFNWSEGPVWLAKKKVLVFSDVPENVVYQWQEGKGISEFLRPSGYTGTVPRGGEP